MGRRRAGRSRHPAPRVPLVAGAAGRLQSRPLQQPAGRRAARRGGRLRRPDAPAGGARARCSGCSRAKCPTSASGTRRTSRSRSARSTGIHLSPIADFHVPAEMWRARHQLRRTSAARSPCCAAVAGAAPRRCFDPALRFRSAGHRALRHLLPSGRGRLAARLAAIAEDVWPPPRPTLGVPRPPRDARRPGRPDRDCRTAGRRRCRTTRSSIYCRRGRRDPSSSATPTTGCGSSSPTSSRTSSTSIAREAGRASSAACSAGRRSRFRTCFCRPGRSKGWRPTRRAPHRREAGCMPATSARSTARRRARRRLEPLDRVNGGLTDWPGGLRAVRVRRSGFTNTSSIGSAPQRSARWPTTRPRRVPFFTARERSRRSTASSLGDALARLPGDAARGGFTPIELDRPSAARRITRHGFDVCRAAVSAAVLRHAARARSSTRVRTPHGFPGAERGGARRVTAAADLTTRYLGSTSGVGRDVDRLRPAGAAAQRRPLQRSLRAEPADRRRHAR